MGTKTHELVAGDAKGHYAWLVWCPACDDTHQFRGWTFNGDHERPTFTPSMLCTYSVGDPSDPSSGVRCHSHLRDGVWHYLDDSTHAYAGKSLPAPDWASTRYARMRPDGVVPHPDDV